VLWVPSFGELIDEVIGTLHGYTTDVPLMGRLVADVTADATELAIDFGGQIARPTGLVEIGRELILCHPVPPRHGVATVFGRGSAAPPPSRTTPGRSSPSGPATRASRSGTR
jgi:hypothetical protein